MTEDEDHATIARTRAYFPGMDSPLLREPYTPPQQRKHTQEIPTGSAVLAAWDANHFIPLDRTALDEPYVARRLQRWTVAGFSAVTGSYELLLEDTCGPRFCTSRSAFAVVIDMRYGSQDHMCSGSWSYLGLNMGGHEVYRCDRANHVGIRPHPSAAHECGNECVSIPGGRQGRGAATA